MSARPAAGGRPLSRRARLTRTAVAFAVLIAVAVVAAVALRGGGARSVVPAAMVVEVRAGQTADAVATKMIAVTGWDQETVAAAFGDPAAAGVPSGATSIEGWLAPGTYPVAPTDTPATVVARMVSEQRAQVVALGLAAAATKQHRTVADLVTIASVAQAEAIPSQYGNVARVVTNRLGAGMALQMDATLNYANGTHVLAHSAAQLTDKSAYNSYIKKGLPPTPIGNPDERALRAAANPPAGPWLYFVLVDKDGTQLFTADYAEFNRAKTKAHDAGLF